ncbi:MAG TPA: hypothetical protein DCL95_06665 [Rhodospirillaceae bacterium]|nr:hypothetical protein [Rhodospirillaceae bacterium]MBB58725.1 hypothetical protein [Rhodospirillaceae bacterium]HAE00140.1 hypothetical protein [Rhodospirillaceae bacterium]HAJ19732.1 hypothetical protein [Rhodospirillaceae bacterium]|tara:strand:- start:37517 stop:37795 length:279 start_codon:yes stop_codon:yes gene_type:complete
MAAADTWVYYCQILLIILLTLCCVAGFVLQFYAWRHLKPGIPRFGHKDAMFRKKDQYYEPEGLKYIDWQKKIMHIMFVLFAALIILIEWSAP